MMWTGIIGDISRFCTWWSKFWWWRCWRHDEDDDDDDVEMVEPLTVKITVATTMAKSTIIMIMTKTVIITVAVAYFHYIKSRSACENLKLQPGQSTTEQQQPRSTWQDYTPEADKKISSQSPLEIDKITHEKQSNQKSTRNWQDYMEIKIIFFSCLLVIVARIFITALQTNPLMFRSPLRFILQCVYRDWWNQLKCDFFF